MTFSLTDVYLSITEAGIVIDKIWKDWNAVVEFFDGKISDAIDAITNDNVKTHVTSEATTVKSNSQTLKDALAALVSSEAGTISGEIASQTSTIESAIGDSTSTVISAMDSQTDEINEHTTDAVDALAGKTASSGTSGTQSKNVVKDSAGTEGELSEFLFPKIKLITDSLDSFFTLKEASITADWQWVADALNYLWNDVIAPAFEFVTDFIIDILSWLMYKIAFIADDFFSAFEEWWGNFLVKYFFIAHTFSMKPILEILQSIFDEVEGEYTTVFTKFKINVSQVDVPDSGVFNLWLPKFLQKVVFTDTSREWFDQDNVEIWQILMEILSLVLFFVLVNLIKTNASKVLKIIFKVKKLFKGNTAPMYYGPSGLTSAMMKMPWKDDMIEDMYSRNRYPMSA